MGSIPFAFLGASISVSKELFEITLFVILSIAGIFLLIESKSFNKDQIKIRQIPKILSISIGSVIGFISGIVGIGGGIFLSPFLFLMKAGYPKHIAKWAEFVLLAIQHPGVEQIRGKFRAYHQFYQCLDQYTS